MPTNLLDLVLWQYDTDLFFPYNDFPHIYKNNFYYND